jgi:hypothetical protein
MSVAKATAAEVFESLTGYDELAITRLFGANPQDVDEDGNSDLSGTMLARALIFVVEGREGKPEAEAFDAAMKMTTPDVIAYFAPEDEESGKEQEPSGDDSVSTPPSA